MSQILSPGDWPQRQSTQSGDVAGTPIEIKSGCAELFYLQVHNPGLSKAFINIYNKDPDDVEFGVTEPELSIMVPSGGAYETPPMTIQFLRGIAISASTTFKGDQAPSTSLNYNAIYR